MQAFVDDAKRRIYVVFVYDERRREPERALAAAEEQEALLERAADEVARHVGRRLAGLAILHELDPDHEAAAPHVADHRVLLLQLARAADEALAHLVDVGQQLLLDDIERRERG